LLSLGEELVSDQLVDIKSQAVIQHGLLEKHLLCRDKIVSDHEIVGLIFHDIVVLVEVARDEGFGLVLLQSDPSLSLGSGEPGVVAGDGGILCQLLIQVLVEKLHVFQVPLEIGGEDDLFKGAPADVTELDKLHRDELVGFEEPALDLDAFSILGELGRLQDDLPLALLALFRFEILFVESLGVDNHSSICGVLAFKEWLFFDHFQYLVAVDEHICIMHLLECGLVLLAQILRAQRFGEPECLAGVAARELGRLLALVALLLMIRSDVLLACNFLVSLLAAACDLLSSSLSLSLSFTLSS
jgi:hypothetical protein